MFEEVCGGVGVMKKCTKCGIEKELSEYHCKSYSRGGYQTNCKDCRNAHKRKWEAPTKRASKINAILAKINDSILKKCHRCGNRKNKNCFYPSETINSGLSSQCKQCSLEQSGEWYRNNEELAKSRNKQRYMDNKEFIAEQCRAYREKNKDKIKIRNRKHFQENREQYYEKSREYYQQNKEAMRLYFREYRRKNKKELNRKEGVWRRKNLGTINAKSRKQSAKNRKEMSDGYIKQIIVARGGIKTEEITSDIIKVTRLLLQAKRKGLISLRP